MCQSCQGTMLVYFYYTIFLHPTSRNDKLINEKIETHPKIYNIKYVHGHNKRVMANPKTQIYFCRMLLTSIDTTYIISYFQGYYGAILLNNLFKMVPGYH
jgi:uncharacterized phage-associated protein